MWTRLDQFRLNDYTLIKRNVHDKTSVQFVGTAILICCNKS